MAKMLPSVVNISWSNSCFSHSQRKSRWDSVFKALYTILYTLYYHILYIYLEITNFSETEFPILIKYIPLANDATEICSFSERIVCEISS